MVPSYVVTSISYGHSLLTVLLDCRHEFIREWTPESQEYLELTPQKQYNEGMCGQTITITAKGKSTQAKVMDLVSDLCTRILLQANLIHLL